MQLFDERLWKIHQAGEGRKMEFFFWEKKRGFPSVSQVGNDGILVSCEVVQSLQSLSTDGLCEDEVIGGFLQHSHLEKVSCDTFFLSGGRWDGWQQDVSL